MKKVFIVLSACFVVSCSLFDGRRADATVRCVLTAPLVLEKDISIIAEVVSGGNIKGAKVFGRVDKINGNTVTCGNEWMLVNGQNETPCAGFAEGLRGTMHTHNTSPEMVDILKTFANEPGYSREYAERLLSKKGDYVVVPAGTEFVLHIKTRDESLWNYKCGIEEDGDAIGACIELPGK